MYKLFHFQEKTTVLPFILNAQRSPLFYVIISLHGIKLRKLGLTADTEIANVELNANVIQSIYNL